MALPQDRRATIVDHCLNVSACMPQPVQNGTIPPPGYHIAVAGGHDIRRQGGVESAPIHARSKAWPRLRCGTRMISSFSYFFKEHP